MPAMAQAAIINARAATFREAILAALSERAVGPFGLRGPLPDEWRGAWQRRLFREPCRAHPLPDAGPGNRVPQSLVS